MSNDNEGPLSKLSKLLGIKSDLATIAAVKRIDERPVSCNPETMFKMAPTPALMDDPGIHHLYGDQLRRAPNARQFDLRFDYASYRPETERWICVDENTYDGAPDAEPPATFIGRGASEKEARTDLLEQFAWHDEEAHKPRVSRMVNHSPFQPPEVSSEPYRDPDDVDFDSDLEDR